MIAIHSRGRRVAMLVALEQIDLAWACVGRTLRLPVVSRVVQLLVDASGGGPASVAGRSPRSVA